MKDLEKQLKAVANRRRLGILQYLKKHREATVGEVANAIHLSFRSTSKHLGVLAAADIVEKEQRNTQMFYRFTPAQPTIVRYIISTL